MPERLTQKLNAHLVCMNGTEKNPARCVALVGEVGQSVTCGIYAQRSSTCRAFEAGSEACNRARARYGLQAITQS